MKKLISCLLVLVFCVSLLCPVMAEDFVPSIGVKEAPELVEDEDGNVAVVVDEEGNEVAMFGRRCLRMIPVGDFEDDEDMTEEEKEELLDEYEKLKEDNSKLPAKDEKERVIRDLFNLKQVCDEDHTVGEGEKIQMTLKLGVPADEDVSVALYSDGEWTLVEDAVNNGDGTVTIKIEKLGMIAISVPAAQEEVKTGDNSQIGMWIAIVAVAAVALVGLGVAARKTGKNRA